jgi:hypothetical protein
MADILVQNAVQEVANTIAASGSGINYTSVLGSDLTTYVGNIISSNSTAGPFASAAGGGGSLLCTLSQFCCLSHCNCNFSGSGSNQCVCNPNSGWRNGEVLASGTVTKTPAEIRTAILAFSSLLTGIYNANNSVVAIDINNAYSSYYDSSLSSDIKSTWYGVAAGGITETPGRRISDSNYVKVCGTGDTWKCGEGATCTWTVPAGASRVKFQVWGAGFGSNPGCCCGGDMGAHTGAYSEVTMDATPGESYTLCAGCSCRRSCCSNTSPGEGCMSGVTGPGICCLKSDGGHCNNANCGSMNAMRCCFGLSACQRNQNPYCTDSGVCWCSNSEYCYDNSCDSCGIIPVYPACCDNVSCYCSCACADRNSSMGATYGHRGMHGGGCFNTGFCGYHIRPPVIDADTGSQYEGGCWCLNFAGENCMGGCLGHAWDSHPGLGGNSTMVRGGINTHKGDYGKGGMVQVSWT